MLYSYFFFTVSPREKNQLLWSLFVNVHGMSGHNVAADLHMKHLNHRDSFHIRIQEIPVRRHCSLEGRTVRLHVSCSSFMES